MSAADDAAVLALLRAMSPPINTSVGPDPDEPVNGVWDGHVEDSDPDAKIISAELPYVVFWGGYDDDVPGDSLSGTSGAHLSDFRLTGVGETREQAKWAMEQVRAVLNRKRITFPAGPRFVRCTENGAYVTRDDTWTRPGGAPLFSGIDQYEVLI